MSAKAEALRLPGAPSGRSHWLVVLLALLVAVGVTVTLTVLSSVGTDTTADRVPPASVSHANDGTAAAPASTVMQVGGTSVYRYHPLPGVNTVFELVGSSGAAATVDAPRVGGSGAYQYHPLP